MTRPIAQNAKGWKTLACNALLSVMPIIELIETQEMLPEEWAPLYTMFVICTNIVLRGITNGPVGWKRKGSL